MSKQPFAFDDVDELDGLDTDEPPEGQTDNAAAVVESLYSPDPETEDAIDTKMAAVEERLAVAQYYRLLLNDSLFNDGTAPARLVEKEVRAFVRGRLEVLMGVRSEEQTQKLDPVFTESEVRVLKQIAKVAESRAQTPVPAQAPTLKRVEATPIRVQPQVQQQGPKPEVRKQLRPEPRRLVPGAPASKNLSVDQTRIPEQYRNDSTLTFKDGRAYVQARDPDNKALWVFDPKTKKREPMLKDVTLPSTPGPRDVQPVPMPSMGPGGQFDMIMQQHSGGMLNVVERKLQASKAGSLLTGALVSGLQQGVTDE